MLTKQMTAMDKLKMTKELYLCADPSKVLTRVIEKVTLGENLRKSQVLIHAMC